MSEAQRAARSVDQALTDIAEEYEGGAQALTHSLTRRRVVDQLVRQRVRSGLTQAEVARRIDTAPSDVSRFEKGEINPGLLKLAAYADAVGGHIAFLPGQPEGLAASASLDEAVGAAASEGEFGPLVNVLAPGPGVCIVLRVEPTDDGRRFIDAVATGIISTLHTLGQSSADLVTVLPVAADARLLLRLNVQQPQRDESVAQKVGEVAF